MSSWLPSRQCEAPSDRTMLLLPRDTHPHPRPYSPRLQVHQGSSGSQLQDFNNICVILVLANLKPSPHCIMEAFLSCSSALGYAKTAIFGIINCTRADLEGKNASQNVSLSVCPANEQIHLPGHAQQGAPIGSFCPHNVPPKRTGPVRSFWVLLSFHQQL